MLKATPQNHVFCYGRASTDRQERTEAVQRDACQKWISFARTVNRLPADIQEGGWFYDFATTSKIDWFMRKQGEALLMMLRKGDVVIVSHLDRAFRCVKDAAQTLDRLDAKGVRLVLLDADVDTSSLMGRFAIKLFALIAEMHREVIRERCKESNRHLIANGKPCGWGRPFGWKVKGKGKDREYVPDYRERKLGELVVESVKQGASFAQVAFELDAHGVKHTHDLPILKRKDLSKAWSMTFCAHAYRATILGYPKRTSAQVTEEFNASADENGWLRPSHARRRASTFRFSDVLASLAQTPQSP